MRMNFENGRKSQTGKSQVAKNSRLFCIILNTLSVQIYALVCSIFVFIMKLLALLHAHSGYLLLLYIEIMFSRHKVAILLIHVIFFVSFC